MRVMVIFTIVSVFVGAGSMWRSLGDADRPLEPQGPKQDGITLFSERDSYHGNSAYKVSEVKLRQQTSWQPPQATPMPIATAYDLARKVVSKQYQLSELDRVRVMSLELRRVPLAGADDRWYYVVAYTLNKAPNPYHPQPEDVIYDKVVFLTDGTVVARHIENEARPDAQAPEKGKEGRQFQPFQVNDAGVSP